MRFAKEQTDPQARPFSAIIMALCSMARPEEVLVFAMSLAAVIYRSIVQRAVTKRDAIWFLVFLAIGVPYFVWRMKYFGYLLPNTFYAKSRGPKQFLAGVLYTVSAIKNHGGLIFLVFAIIPIFGERNRRETHYLFSLVAAWLAFNIYKGHDVLPIDSSCRFFRSGWFYRF